MPMRLFVFICGVALLGACATAPDRSSPPLPDPGPPTSELSSGQCGLFGWSTGDTRDFIFYADKKAARYDGLDGPIDLTAQSAFPSTEYKDPSGNPVTLRLGQGEIMSGGMRYPGARVVTMTKEGWERLHPVAIVRTCPPASTE